METQKQKETRSKLEAKGDSKQNQKQKQMKKKELRVFRGDYILENFGSKKKKKKGARGTRDVNKNIGKFKKMGSIPNFINKIMGGNGNEGFRLSDGLSGLMNSFSKNGAMDIDKLEDLAGKVANHAGSKEQLHKLAKHAAKIKKNKMAGRETFVSKMNFKPAASNDVSMYAQF